MYAKVSNGVLLQYPYTIAQLKADNPNTSFPTTIIVASVSEFGIVEVAPTDAPTFDAITQTRAEGDPVLIDGVWTQQWVVTDLDAATIAANQAAAVAALQADIVQQTQNRLDDFARTRNYDGILSACTYATSSVPKFQAEGQYAVNARDNTWATLYTLMAEVQAGTRPMPTGFADVEPLLPALAWPA